MSEASRFELPGGVALELRPAGGPVAARLARELARFGAPAGGAAAETVVVEPLDPAGLHVERAWAIAPPLGAAPACYQGRRAVACWHRTAPEFVLVPSAPTRVCYLHRRGSAGRIYYFVLLALEHALRRAGGALLHGAAWTTPEERAVLVLGPRGSRKTGLLLESLREGGQYLAEDKLILAAGLLHPFQELIGLRRHHFVELPWLADRLAPPGAHRLRSWLAGRFLPDALLPGAARRLDRSVRAPLDRLLPRTEIAPPARPTDLVLLEVGDGQPALVPLERGAALSRAAACQALLFHRPEPVDLLAVLCDGAMPGIGSVLGPALEQARCFELTLPPGAPLAAAVRTLREGLER